MFSKSKMTCQMRNGTPERSTHRPINSRARSPLINAKMDSLLYAILGSLLRNRFRLALVAFTV
jgi:hypothetical protein